MKKLTKIFLVICCLLVLPFALIFTACDLNTLTADNVQVRVEDDKIQWSIDGEKWTDIISVDDLKDQLGDSIKGDQGNAGIDGKEVEFQKTETHIQWRYKTPNNDGEWQNLVALSDIKGDQGDPGQDATVVEYTLTIEYDDNFVLPASDVFTNTNATIKVNSNQWVTTLPEVKIDALKDYFAGWYIKGTNKKIENYDLIGGNATLEARWQEDYLDGYHVYHNAQVYAQIADDNELAEEYFMTVCNGMVNEDFTIDYSNSNQTIFSGSYSYILTGTDTMLWVVDEDSSLMYGYSNESVTITNYDESGFNSLIVANIILGVSEIHDLNVVSSELLNDGSIKMRVSIEQLYFGSSDRYYIISNDKLNEMIDATVPTSTATISYVNNLDPLTIDSEPFCNYQHMTLYGYEGIDVSKINGEYLTHVKTFEVSKTIDVSDFTYLNDNCLLFVENEYWAYYVKEDLSLKVESVYVNYKEGSTRTDLYGLGIRQELDPQVEIIHLYSESDSLGELYDYDTYKTRALYDDLLASDYGVRFINHEAEIRISCFSGGLHDATPYQVETKTINLNEAEIVSTSGGTMLKFTFNNIHNQGDSSMDYIESVDVYLALYLINNN